MTAFSPRVLRNLGLFMTALLLALSFMTMTVHATDLNGIGADPTPAPQQQPEQTTQQAPVQPQQATVTPTDPSQVGQSQGSNDPSQSVRDLFNTTVLTDEDIEKSRSFVEPGARVINRITLAVFAILGSVLTLIFALDMLYLAVPFIRPLLVRGQQQADSGMGGMGMGYGGGYRGGYVGYGGGAQSSGGRSWQLVSDEAMHALQEYQQSQQGAGGGAVGGMGMGMGYGGGYGGSFGGGAAGGQQPSMTSRMMMVNYMKRRVIFLVCLGMSLVLFMSTLFTDIGIYFGEWVMDKLSGMIGL